MERIRLWDIDERNKVAIVMMVTRAPVKGEYILYGVQNYKVLAVQLNANATPNHPYGNATVYATRSMPLDELIMFGKIDLLRHEH